MRPALLLRLSTFALAYVHTFPARKHLVAFYERPSWMEAWEGFGALLAITLYLLPVSVQARALTALWQERRYVLRACGLLMALVHAVPAADHLPRFIAAPGWADGWRGLGSTLAIAWFLAPLPIQAIVIASLARLGRLPRVRARSRKHTFAKTSLWPSRTSSN